MTNDRQREIEDQLRQAADGIQRAYPAARNAIEGALARLNAPWYVRAYHQAKRDEGWGLGEELQIFMAVLGIVGLLAFVWWINK